MPVPVVVDADVLIRNVDYAARRGYKGALFGQASSNYSLLTGVALFATSKVGAEAIRHLPDIARRRRLSLTEVHDIWNDWIVPHVRFVIVDDHAIDDPRVEQVRSDHPADCPTAVLTILLAPAILATDNRRHFRGLDLSDAKTDDVAADLFALGQFGLGLNGTLLFPRLTGAATVGASRRLIATVGTQGAAIIALLALSGMAWFATSERGRYVRAALAAVARDAGPPLARYMAETVAAGERIAAFVVEPSSSPSAAGFVARRLAVERSVLTTSEISRELRDHGFRFEGARRFETETRAWLEAQPYFDELSRGRWVFGYQSAFLSQ